MAKIEIYARLRPTQKHFAGLKTSADRVSVEVGKMREDGLAERYARAPGARHDFKFSRAFDEDATQGDVFETVARKMVDRFVEGYNGTVFAYGQTSTGKTYTVEGSARQYEERGLIPRTLSYLYDLLEKKKELLERPYSGTAPGNEQEYCDSDSSVPNVGVKDTEFTSEEERGRGEVKVHISYMEIYQDTGFDLLNPGNRPGSLMLTLPKVQVREGTGGRVVVRDLSLHEATTEQIALSLLFQGSTCRKVAETAMNQSSSRSHTIFTITLTTKQQGSEVILRSKLHLVDLAGSERVSKTGSDGRILQEAKYINLSLHHLEHVIVSLQQQARSSHSLDDGRRRGHIPYRNSMLTMVLRDSLGGNCLTAMIATVSSEEANICETISTLRFSQRVACISNTASRNEELDDKAVIKKLKKRVTELERELTNLRESKSLPSQMVGVKAAPGGSGTVVSETERALCHRVLYDFFHGRITNPVEAGINTPTLFQECLQVLRNIVIDAIKSKDSSSTHPFSPTHTHKGDVTEKRAIRNTCGSSDGDFGEKSEKESHRKRSKKRRSQNKLQSVSEIHNSSQCHSSHTTPSPTSHPHTPTPRNTTSATPTSPASRLSSGIGSLREEDIELTSPLSRMGTRHSVEKIKGKSLEYGVVGTQSSVGNDVHGDRKKEGHQQKDRSETWARKVVHNRMTSENDPIARFSQAANTSQNSHLLSPQTQRGYDSHELMKSPLVKSSNDHKQPPSVKSSPPDIREAHSNSLEKLRVSHSTHSTPHTKTTAPTTSGSNSAPEAARRHNAQAKSLSRRALSTQPPVLSPEARVMGHLQEEREKLQRSQEKKQQLSGNIHLLSLQVEKEELRTQLQVVGEQLASQHARVLAYQQQVTSSQSSPSDDMCSEKIAEQQLRIKQARLHQRFLSVQHQIRSLQPSPQSTLSKSLPISPPTTTPVTSPPKASMATLVNEATRTELRHTKVQNEIEQLQVSEIEKQLHLKEVATRRKLQELRQQLENSPHIAPVSHNSSVSIPDRSVGQSPFHNSSTVSHTHSCALPYSQSVIQSYTHSKNPWNGSVHSAASSSIAPHELKPDNHISTDTRCTCVQDPNTSTADLKCFRKSPKTTKHILNCEVQTNSGELSAKVASPSTPTALSTMHTQPPSSPSSHQNGLELLKTGRTTLPSGPARVNEGQYMKAVQLQRVRVSRIRRCIEAATTIQRAWRTHRERCIYLVT